MKTTKKTNVIELAEKLTKIKELQKSLNDQEAEVKGELKSAMERMETKTLQVGPYLLLITDRTRTDLDKAKVRSILGPEYVTCLIKTEYQIFEMRKV